MSCPNEADLIRLIAGEFEPAAANDLRGHLNGCPVCAAVVGELVATWEVMGAWDDEGAPSDLWPTVRSSVELAARRRSGWVPRTAPALLQTAASVVVAVGLGWLAGSWLAGPAAPEPTSPDFTAEQELIVSLGLDEFASFSATGLPEALLSTGEEPSEEEP